MMILNLGFLSVDYEVSQVQSLKVSTGRCYIDIFD